MAKTANKGFKRLFNAAIYSWQGIKSAFINEEAFRQEIYLLVFLVPVAIYFGKTVSDQILLICSFLLVLIVELLNSAIEATVDRISDEKHELSGRAKDMGSASVLIALLIFVGVWVSILIF